VIACLVSLLHLSTFYVRGLNKADDSIWNYITEPTGFRRKQMDKIFIYLFIYWMDGWMDVINKI
jgi:hypothetical protein